MLHKFDKCKSEIKFIYDKCNDPLFSTIDNAGNIPISKHGVSISIPIDNLAEVNITIRMTEADVDLLFDIVDDDNMPLTLVLS